MTGHSTSPEPTTTTIQECSVGDPEPDPNPHVFGPPGSEVWIRIRGMDSDSAPDPALDLDPSLSCKGVERTEIMLEN